MKLGAMYPEYEIGADPDDLSAFAKAAEALGFDYVGFPDHVLATSPDRTPPIPALFTEKDLWQDPFCIFAYLAGMTTRIDFFTSILILPQRQTALVARQAADVDLLSGGRLNLAVGLGWNYAEYDALGVNYRTRGRKLDAQIPLLRELWSAPILNSDGAFDRVIAAGLNPRPRRQIPIWVGGLSEPAYRRGARLGDGFVFAADFDTACARAERVCANLEIIGRPRDGFGLQFVPANLDRSKRLGAEWSADQLRRWRDWGGSHGTVATSEQGLRTIDEHIAFLAEIHQRVAR